MTNPMSNLDVIIVAAAFAALCLPAILSVSTIIAGTKERRRIRKIMEGYDPHKYDRKGKANDT